MTDDLEKRLFVELDRWQAAGRVAPFWLRDDDAVAPTPALDRLMDSVRAFSVPVVLAVIPAGTAEPLAVRLACEPLATVVVHGWSHTNYAEADEKKQELGRHRRADAVLAELRQGRQKLAQLHGQRFVSMLVPPWNRIDKALLPHLADCGFSALSVFGPEKDIGLPVINSHVDVMDWHGTRGGRDPAALVTEIIARLRVMFETGGTMGLLTHHLVHDEAVWSFMTWLFETTSRHPACRWVAVEELI